MRYVTTSDVSQAAFWLECGFAYKYADVWIGIGGERVVFFVFDRMGCSLEQSEMDMHQTLVHPDSFARGLLALLEERQGVLDLKTTMEEIHDV